MLPIVMEEITTLWTSLGRETLYHVTYSNGMKKRKWYIRHDITENRFHLYHR